MKTPPADMAQRLWEAAPELLSSDAELSVVDVAEATRIPRATLYYYFSGKADLAAFLGERMVIMAAEASAQAAATAGSVPDRLRRALIAIYEPPPGMPTITAALLSVLASTGDFIPTLVKLREVGFRAVRDLIVEGARSGELLVEDAEVAVSTVFGALEVVAILQLDGNKMIDLDAIAGSVDILVRGLSAETLVARPVPAGT